MQPTRIQSLVEAPHTAEAGTDQPRSTNPDSVSQSQTVDQPPSSVSDSVFSKWMRAGTVASIPGYEILGELGRGGMGVVYQARQLAANRVVALKMILAGGHASEGELQRFHREAEAVARLSHPHIVQIFEVGEHEGRPFFTLEFLSGGSLAGLLKQNPLSASNAAKLVEKLARAMDTAHQAGIVHRDLKPANVLLDGVGEPKVTDFGLARRLDTDEGQTRTGAVMGTPSYMAPEQALGETKSAGQPADIYALGAILYECLTGRPPFKGATLLETLDQVRTREPVAVRQLQPAVPRDLETICLKCLQKQAARRYATAGELADDLRRFLDQRPITARPVGTLEQTWKWVRRNQVVSGLLAGIFVILLVGIVLVTSAYSTALREKKVADDARGTAIFEMKEADDARGIADIARRNAEASDERSKRDLAVSSVLNAKYTWDDPDAIPMAAYTWLEKVPPERRRWEWNYFAKQFEGSTLSLPGHSRSVEAVAWTTDGNHFLSTSGKEVIHWNAVQGTVRERFFVQDLGAFHDLAIHLRTNIAMAGMGFGRWIAIDLKSHQLDSIDTGMQSTLINVEAHPTEDQFVFLMSDRKTSEIAVWDIPGKKLVRRIPVPNLQPKSLALSPDGRRAVVGGETAGRAAAVIFDLGGNAKPVPLNITAQQSAFVRWNPNGNTIAVAAYADLPTHRLWMMDAVTGKEVFSIDRVLLVPESICFSPDGLIVAAADHGDIVLWDAGTGRKLREYKGHLARVTALAFAPDGRRLLSGGRDGLVKVWDVAQNPRGFFLAERLGDIRELNTSRDGEQVAVVNKANRDAALQLQAWNLRTGQHTFAQTIQEDFIGQLLFTHDGKELITVGGLKNQHGLISVRDAETGQLLRHWRTRDCCFSASLTPDGRHLLTGNGNLLNDDSSTPRGELELWEVQTGKLVRDWKGHFPNSVTALGISPDGRYVATAMQRKLEWWDLATGELVGIIPIQAHTANDVSYSPDGKVIAVGYNGGGIEVWDLETRRSLAYYETHAVGPSAILFTPDGSRMVASDQSGMIRFWDTTSWQEVLKLKCLPSYARALAFGRDNLFLAGRDDGKIQVWSAPPKQSMIRLERLQQPVESVIISSQGRFLASGSQIYAKLSGQVAIWDLRERKLLRLLSDLPGPPRGLAFSPDEQWLAASINVNDNERMVMVWDRISGEVRYRLPCERKFNASLAFSADNLRLTLGTPANRQSWSMTSGEPILPLATDPVGSLPSFIAFNQSVVAVSLLFQHQLILFPRIPATPLDAVLHQHWSRADATDHIALANSYHQQNLGFAATYHADQALRIKSTVTPADYLRWKRALYLGLTQVKNHDEFRGQGVQAATLTLPIGPTMANWLPWAWKRATESRDSEKWRDLGVLNLRLHNLDDAIPPLRMAKELRPKDAPPFEELWLALAYQQQGKGDDARHMRNAAEDWFNRDRAFLQTVSMIGVGTNGFAGFAPVLGAGPTDLRYRSADWWMWYQLSQLRREVETKVR